MAQRRHGHSAAKPRSRLARLSPWPSPSPCAGGVGGVLQATREAAGGAAPGVLTSGPAAGGPGLRVRSALTLAHRPRGRGQVSIFLRLDVSIRRHREGNGRLDIMRIKRTDNGCEKASPGPGPEQASSKRSCLSPAQRRECPGRGLGRGCHSQCCPRLTFTCEPRGRTPP